MTRDLSGEWVGYYRGNCDQFIRITQTGDEVEARKITGDSHIPGGELTFRANLKTGKGEGQVAEVEFRNAQWIPGKLKVLGPERIVFSWGSIGEVEFRRDD